MHPNLVRDPPRSAPAATASLFRRLPAPSPGLGDAIGRMLTRAGIAGVLLALSFIISAAFPIRVEISGRPGRLTVAVDGRLETIAVERPVRAVRFETPPPSAREIAIDGSDSLNNFTLDEGYFSRIAESPLYRWQAWLRDEATLSSWRNLVVRDTGLSGIGSSWTRPPEARLALPAEFALNVELYRLEAPPAIRLDDLRGKTWVLTIDRNDRFVRLVEDGADAPAARWYFPTDWRPAAANLAALLLRVGALGFVLSLLPVVPALVAPAIRGWRLGSLSKWMPVLAPSVALAGGIWAAFGLFAAVPHIYDAIAYAFQARIFAGGNLTAPAAPLPDAFPIPFTIISGDRWFAQYPPGTSLVLALGYRVGLPWLVGPLQAAGIVALVYGITRRQAGRGTAAIATGLLAISPLLLLQSAAFFSHVPALFWAVLFLFAALRLIDHPTLGWAAVAGGALGLAFLTREVTAVLYGTIFGPYLVWLGWRRYSRRVLPLLAVVAGCALVGVAAWLLYNLAQTGSPLVLPRHLFDSADRFGFGAGVGFFGRHTLAAGLVNTEQLLTALSVWLFGWPLNVALAVALLPFLLRRATLWDWLNGALIVVLVGAYVAYFYHGIAIGPRYYVDALPALALLAARGLVVLHADLSALLAGFGRSQPFTRARFTVALLAAVLVAWDFAFFLPRQATLYAARSDTRSAIEQALPDDVPPGGRLVVTDNRSLFIDRLGALLCPRLDCPTLYAYAEDTAAEASLQAAFPERTWLRIVEDPDGIRVVPSAAR